ncbi:MAG: hypothetical protein ACREFI_19915, partial [Stellaceae bacterium]
TRTDAAGARIRAEVPFAYDADQALVAQDTYNAVPDARGNFCSDWTRPDCDFKYDALDRLTAWHDRSYRYDGEGRLLDWRDAKGVGERYTYLGQSLVALADPQGGPSAVYVPGPDGLTWSAMFGRTGDFYPLRSANGSLLAVLDEHGEVAGSCLYRSYGLAFSWSKDAATPACEFAGGRIHGPGVWFGTRVLHGIGARFMSPDPTGPDKDGNLYSYALDNPLRFVDASGTTAIPLGPQPPLYRQLLQGAGVPPNAAGLKQTLIDQFKQIAATSPSEATRQEAKAVSIVLENNIVPLKLNPAVVPGEGAYNKVLRQVTTNVEVIAQKEPVDYMQALRGNVVHEAAGHGLDGADTRLWMENPDAPIMKAWGEAGVEPIYGVTKPYSRVEEINAWTQQWRFDPTLGNSFPTGGYASEEEAREWIVNAIAKDAQNAASAYSPERIQEVNDNILKLIGEKDFYTKTFPAGSNQAVSENIQALREARAAQAIEAAERLPLAGAAESVVSRGVVERAVAREAVELGAAAEKGAARQLAESLLGAAKKYFPGEALKEVLLPGLLELAEPIGTVLLVKDLTMMAASAAAWAGRQLGNLIAKPLEDAFKQLDALDTPEEQQKRKRRRAAAADRMLGPSEASLMGPLLVDASYPGDQTASAPNAPAGGGSNDQTGAGGGASSEPTAPSSGSSGSVPNPSHPPPPIVNQPLGEPPPNANAGGTTTAPSGVTPPTAPPSTNSANGSPTSNTGGNQPGAGGSSGAGSVNAGQPPSPPPSPGSSAPGAPTSGPSGAANPPLGSGNGASPPASNGTTTPPASGGGTTSTASLPPPSGAPPASGSQPAPGSGPSKPSPNAGAPAPATSPSGAPASPSANAGGGSSAPPQPPASTGPGQVGRGSGASTPLPPRRFPSRPGGGSSGSDTSGDDQTASAPDSGQDGSPSGGSGGMAGALENIAKQMNGGAGPGNNGGSLPPPPGTLPPPPLGPQPPGPSGTQPPPGPSTAQPQPPAPQPPQTGSN